MTSQLLGEQTTQLASLNLNKALLWSHLACEHEGRSCEQCSASGAPSWAQLDSVRSLQVAQKLTSSSESRLAASEGVSNQFGLAQAVHGNAERGVAGGAKRKRPCRTRTFET